MIDWEAMKKVLVAIYDIVPVNDTMSYIAEEEVSAPPAPHGSECDQAGISGNCETLACPVFARGECEYTLD